MTDSCDIIDLTCKLDLLIIGGVYMSFGVMLL